MKKALVSCLVAFLFGCPFAAGGEYLRYEELVGQIKDGNVAEITLGPGSEITGALKRDGAEQDFVSFHKSTAPEDPLLLALLRENNVHVTLGSAGSGTDVPPGQGPAGGDDPAGVMAAGLFMLVLPIVTLVYIIKVNARAKRIEARLDQAGIGPAYWEPTGPPEQPVQ